MGIDKSRAKLASDLEAQAQALDQAQILNNAMEKKAKQFDRIVGEWKQKVDGTIMDLDNAQKETRNASSDLFKVKNAYDEAVLQLDEVRRENKNLSNEIKDIMDQISEGGRSIHEIDKICKRLDAEKMELEAAMGEAEGALEQEENKVLRAQLELTQVRQEIERRIAEKDEEFMGVKKNMGKAIEGMQAAFEQEGKGKAEGLRMKKKLEGDVGELEIALEHSNANNLETQKAIKKYQIQIRDSAAKLEEEQRAKEHARDALVAAEENLMQLKMLWRKHELSWNKLTGIEEPLNKSWLMLMNLFLMPLLQIKQLLQLRGNWIQNCKLCMLTLMRCLLKQDFVKKRQARLWLMQQNWLMNSELSKKVPRDWREDENLVNLNLRTCKADLMRLKPML